MFFLVGRKIAVSWQPSFHRHSWKYVSPLRGHLSCRIFTSSASLSGKLFENTFPSGVPHVSVYLKNSAYFPLELLKSRHCGLICLGQQNAAMSSKRLQYIPHYLFVFSSKCLLTWKKIAMCSAAVCSNSIIWAARNCKPKNYPRTSIKKAELFQIMACFTVSVKIWYFSWSENVNASHEQNWCVLIDCV
jgi:hypothetical protein